MPLRVLFVCTGNVCRSPTAELTFRADAGGRVVVASSGIAARDGDPVDPPTATALIRLGLDPSPHRARRFSPAMAGLADLVLTADREQRDRVMLAAPEAFRRTFTIKEFARAAAAARSRTTTPIDATHVVALASRYRGVAGRLPAAADDIADAVGGSAAEVDRMLNEVRAVIGEVVQLLGVARPRPSPRPRPRPRRRPRPGAVEKHLTTAPSE